MKKRYLIILILTISLLLTGCGKNSENNNNQSGDYTTTKKVADHKIYKYMKMSSPNGTSLINNIEYTFDYMSVVGYGDTSYNPCMLVEYDTETGKATNVKFYSFFLDHTPSYEWVDKAIEKYESSSSKDKENYSNVEKGRVNDEVTYISFNVKVDSYYYEQFIRNLIEDQDIEKYKKDVYYDNLYNYSTTPEVKDESNLFYTTLTGVTIEWSDSEFSAY